jgi:hypothetical protein
MTTDINARIVRSLTMVKRHQARSLAANKTNSFLISEYHRKNTCRQKVMMRNWQ